MARTREIARPWTQQPQGAVRVAGDLARDLSLLVNFGADASNQLGGAPIARGAAQLGLSPLGRALLCPGGAQQSYGYAVSPSGATQPLSALLAAHITAHGALFSVAGNYYSEEPLLLLTSDASNIKLYAAGNYRVSAPRFIGLAIIGVRFDGAALELWINGAMAGSAALGSLGSYNSSNLYIGGGYGNSADAQYAACAYWRRDIGREAMRLLTTNPWAMFAPATRRIFVPGGAAAAPAITLQADGSLLHKPSPAGGDKLLFLSAAGAVVAKTAPGAGDKRISLAGGNWLAS